MPTYIHVCTEEDCGYEWEDFYSIMDEPPKICPKCEKESAKRLISGGSGKGIVCLTGHELTAKLKTDAEKMKKECATNESYLANFIGEEKYQNNVSADEKAKKEANYAKRCFKRVDR